MGVTLTLAGSGMLGVAYGARAVDATERKWDVGQQLWSAQEGGAKGGE